MGDGALGWGARMFKISSDHSATFHPAHTILKNTIWGGDTGNLPSTEPDASKRRCQKEAATL